MLCHLDLPAPHLFPYIHYKSITGLCAFAILPSDWISPVVLHVHQRLSLSLCVLFGAEQVVYERRWGGVGGGVRAFMLIVAACCG